MIEPVAEASFKNKVKEASIKGTLLFELVNDVQRFSKKAKVNICCDLGGRDGGNLILLERYGVKYNEAYVIDLFPRPIFKNLKYIRLDLSKDNLPFNDSSVDLVLLIEVIEHLIDPDFCLKEIKRILSPGGIAIITTPNLAWWPNILLLASASQPIFTEVSSRKIYGRKGSVVGHLRVFTYLSLLEMLLDFGFKILKYKTVRTSVTEQLPKFLQIIDLLVHKFNKRLGCDIYCVATK
ncbi:MAG: class I SAM-dependent methyltransferase [Nitrososphaeria archaeon]